MAISELRILPPLAIGRFGSSPTPLEAYRLDPPADDDPFGYRRIKPETTFLIDAKTGAIAKSYTPERIQFTDVDEKGRTCCIRPVAPFLEVFALTGQGLAPLTFDLLKKEKIDPKKLRWTIEVVNAKAFRQTGDPGDRISAKVEFGDHASHELRGECQNFLDGKYISFGSVRFIKPTAALPEVRLRFTPPAGKVYGASPHRFHFKNKVRIDDEKRDEVFDDDSRIVYDVKKGNWRGFQLPDLTSPLTTNPNDIYEGADPDPQDPNEGKGNRGRWSWGYLDDVCDGSVTVTLPCKGKEPLTARAWICACMPVFAPDSLPLRAVADELEQAILGPEVPDQEVSVEKAAELVYRALETVRFMNTRVMNGNTIDGRDNVAGTLVRQDTGDFGRLYAPIFASSLVDNFAVRALHERIIVALRSGTAPWFAEVLRRPDEIGDLSDKGRRKMPSMLRGADSRTLTLTRRQINMILKAALLQACAR